MKEVADRFINDNKVFVWIGVATIGLLLVPLLAMQVTDAVRWTVFDFIIMGLLLLLFSSSFVLAARRVSKKSLPFVGIATLLIFLYIWAELAVGVFF